MRHEPLLNKWVKGLMAMVFIMAIRFIGGENRSIRRKLQTCRKSLTKLYHIMLYQVHLARAGFVLTLVVIGTDIGIKRNINRNWHHNTELKRWRHVTGQWRPWTILKANCVCIILKKIRVFINSWFVMPWCRKGMVTIYNSNVKDYFMKKKKKITISIEINHKE